MPRPKSSRKERKCLVCGGVTRVAHMGRDVCRACTVFYRRSKGKKYVCRSETFQCPIGEECRKCRYDRLHRIAKSGSMANESDDSQDEYQPNNSTALDDEPNDGVQDMPEPYPGSSLSPVSGSISPIQALQGTPLIIKISEKYRVMCETRLTSELSSRADPPHPLRVNVYNYPVFPATYYTVNRANRIFLTTLLQFGVATFPEFSTFSERDQWTIVTNFFGRFRTFEAAYRADKVFPNEVEKGFQGYTLYFSEDVVDHFYDDCPNGGDKEEAKRVMRSRFKTNLGPHRESIRRIGHCHEEFLASLAMMFWSTEGLDVSEEVATTSQMYKEIILRELHNYYREQLQLQDYATRLGEVLMFMQTYEQRAGDMDKHLELLRLLNVFSEDTVAYRLTNI